MLIFWASLNKVFKMSKNSSDIEITEANQEIIQDFFLKFKEMKEFTLKSIIVNFIIIIIWPIVLIYLCILLFITIIGFLKK